MLNYTDTSRFIKNVRNTMYRKECMEFYLRDESLGRVKHILFFEGVF